MNEITIFNDSCKGCMLCVNACKAGVLEKSEVRGKLGYLLPKASSPDKCVACMMCELVCPEMAIEVKKGTKEAGQ